MLQELGRKFRKRVFTVLDAGAARSTGVKVLRDVVGGVDELIGNPFADPDASAAVATPVVPLKREPAPVLVYFDGKDHRTKKRIDDLLLGAGVSAKTLDVTDDEASRSWALQKSGKHELPLVFIAGESVGDFDDLLQLSANDGLKKRVFGD
jgi:glutaredoxin